MRMRNVTIASVWLAAMLVAAPVSAQIVQSVHVGFGGFVPRGFDARDLDDTLVANLSAAEPLDFQISRFKAATLFGEWNVQFGKHIELSAGIGYYSDSVPSVYKNLVNTNGSEIRQSLRLRIIPVTGIVRFLPFGDPSKVQPYVGVGVVGYRFRYSESGQFVDTSDNSVYTDRYIATGTPAGFVSVVGLRAPVGGDIYAITMEWRYQVGVGKTGGLAQGFLGEKIDLGGGNFNVGFLVRF
jgi:hypothetical protein